MVLVKPYEEELIEDQVEGAEVQKRLKEVWNKIRNGQRFEVFSDGSLNNSMEGMKKSDLGIGWVISSIDDKIVNIEFSCRFSDWPASMRAELGAIWTAILTMPHRAEVHIHTDSACAIKA